MHGTQVSGWAGGGAADASEVKGPGAGPGFEAEWEGLTQFWTV